MAASSALRSSQFLLWMLAWTIVWTGSVESFQLLPHSFSSPSARTQNNHLPNPFRPRTALAFVNNNNNRKPEQQQPDEDFAKWVSSNLKQWPKLPDSKPSENKSLNKSDNKLDETFFLNSPLTRLLNFKTLLLLTQQKEEEPELETSSANNLLMGAKETVSGYWKLVPSWDDTLRTSEEMVRTATSRLESILSKSMLKNETIDALIQQSSQTSPKELLESVQTVGLQNGLNVSEAFDLAKETTAFANYLLQITDGLLRKGYVGEETSSQKEPILQDVPSVDGSRPLFDGFATVKEVPNDAILNLASSMGYLAGAVYEETVPRCQELNHCLVVKNVTQDVTWMLTDSVLDGALVRTLTVSGFDASDESVDRERLLNRICTATPVPYGRQGLVVHSGLYDLAQAVYRDVQPYLEYTSDSQKIILNGHSVGGSISILLLLIMIKDYGSEFVDSKIHRVFSFGSPPVVATTRKSNQNFDHLKSLGVPNDLVHGFVQPWDPIVRLFSEIDSLYPLVGDLGLDGNTPWADGPPRALRPILKAVFESWDGWPQFRETYRGTANQTYSSVGLQHILLPEPKRYLSDRFVAVNIGIPDVQGVVQISSHELYSALVAAFPLDVFEVSYVPQALRGFIHHFYPAYGSPLVEYTKEQLSKNKAAAETRVNRIQLANESSSRRRRNGFSTNETALVVEA